MQKYMNEFISSNLFESEVSGIIFVKDRSTIPKFVSIAYVEHTSASVPKGFLMERVVIILF